MIFYTFNSTWALPCFMETGNIEHHFRIISCTPCKLMYILYITLSFSFSYSLHLSHAQAMLRGELWDSVIAMVLWAAWLPLLSQPDPLSISWWKNEVSSGRIPSQTQWRESGSVLQWRVGNYLRWWLHLGQRSCFVSSSRVRGGTKLVAQCQVWTGQWWDKNKPY